jgi:hypothetical protein
VSRRRGRVKLEDLDLTGRRFGRLVAVQRVPRPARVQGQPNAHRRAFWWLECDCGRVKIACHHDLLYGGTRSCGCLQAETRRANAAALNASRARWLTHDGITDTISGWAARLGIRDTALQYRLARWPLEQALTRPAKPGVPREVER